MYKIGDIYNVINYETLHNVKTKNMRITFNKKKKTEVNIYKYLQQYKQKVENTKIKLEKKTRMNKKKEEASIIGQNNLLCGNIVKVGY